MTNAQIEISLQGRDLTHNGILEKEEEVSPGIFANISKGKLYVYLPSSNTRSVGTSMVLCPGGGYIIESMQEEGHLMAEWLASQGIVSIVYKYRLPNKQNNILLADAEEVFEIIRNNAHQWHIDKDKIGIVGFSAGGHLASLIATSLKTEIRPNFSVLFYPVISMEDTLTHQGTKSRLFETTPTIQELKKMSTNECVDSYTPPTLLFLSDDDVVVNPLNSIYFYEQLKKHNIPASMYIFPIGNHGYGFSKNFPYHENIKLHLLQWLKNRKLIF